MNQVQTERRSKAQYLKYLVYLIPIALILLGYFSLTFVTGEPGGPFTIVDGQSMEPTIMPASVALIENVPFNQLQIGDVIVFTPVVATFGPCGSQSVSSPTTEAGIPCHVIHRIVSIQVEQNGSRVITTKGDNNLISLANIDTNITQSMYLGKVMLQIPLLGYITFPPYNEYLALVIVIILVVELLFERKGSSKRQQG